MARCYRAFCDVNQMRGFYQQYVNALKQPGKGILAIQGPVWATLASTAADVHMTGHSPSVDYQLAVVSAMFFGGLHAALRGYAVASCIGVL